jgi:hypothetical protein
MLKRYSTILVVHRIALPLPTATLASGYFAFQARHSLIIGLRLQWVIAIEISKNLI